MPDTVVRYTTPSGGQEELPIRFLGEDANFRLETDKIEKRMTAEIGPRLMDLLEIAAAVFCADTSFSRGSLDQPREGRKWRRSFAFRFAVRDHAFWAQAEVSRALRNTLEFMTGDNFDCAFQQAAVSPNIQSYFKFDTQASEAFDVDDVILFSGGLDSLAGALEALRKTDRRIALVTHYSAQKTIGRQNALVAQLRADFHDRFLWVPVHVHRRGSAGKESTQRSRSFLFAALGCVVARMLRADRLQFFENGIVSQNLPIARPIVGTLATRTTHPKTLKNLGDFLSEVIGQPFDVTNEFEWMTKTEVVQKIAELRQSRLIASTVSCNHTFKRTTAERHCGSCSQCLDRRFAVLANGLESHDPADDYATDVLFGGREREDERALVIEWVRHASRLAQMSRSSFMTKFTSELMRLGSAYSDREEAIEKAHDLHQRHGQAVASVLEKHLAKSVPKPEDGSIASAFSGLPQPSAPPTPIINPEPVASPRAPHGEQDILQLVQHDRNRVSIVGLQDFAGTKARIISALLDSLLADRATHRALPKYQRISASALADELGVAEENIRQEIKRIRDDLRESWEAIHGCAPARDILIRTQHGKGYYLDPRTALVAPEVPV